MSSILQKDSALSFPANVIVSASAGSGKTYTLTQRYVQFLLSDLVPNHGLPNILAMTFTNLAAKEMRQRILRYLKALSLGGERELVEMAGIVSLEKREIRERATQLIDRIISSYSDFQVKTIDSFMVGVFKSSALDFGFNPDVEILLTDDTLISAAFDKYSRELTQHPGRAALLDELVDLMTQTREGIKKYLWDPYTNIAQEVTTLYEMLSSQPKDPVLHDYSDELRSLREHIRLHAERLDALLKGAGIPVYHYLKNDLDEIKAGAVDTVVGRTIKGKITGKLSVVTQRAFNNIKDDVTTTFAAYAGCIARYRICSALMYYQPYLKAVVEIREVLDGLKRQRGQLFIHDVNKKLVGMMREGRIPDVYFRLGDTIHHFLIDEFQDTSPIQWANMKPLIENSLAQEGGSLFIVGDTKQSIYGFRFADWTIMKRLMTQNEFPSAVRTVAVLDTNWRSHERILDFNREVFQRIIPAGEYARAGAESGLDKSGQNVRAGYEGKGYVEAVVFHKDEATVPEHTALLAIIADAKARGHRLRDIALLTPKNEEVIKVSGWLNREGIRFISHSSLDIRTRKVTGEIIALLQFLDSPIDDLSFATFVLGDIFHSVLRRDAAPATREAFQDMIAASYRERRSPLYKVFQDVNPELWERHFAGLYGTVGYLPLYDLVSEVFKVFDVFQTSAENEGTLTKLLEVVKLFEESGNNSIKEFLTFALDDADGSGWEMDVPADDDAVTLMTIHKAKGLDFPVVVVLLYDASVRSNEYYVDESDEGITLLYVPRKFTDNVEYLEKIHDREKLKNEVDELNKLYVALTRAKEEMFVLGVYEKERKLPTQLLPDLLFTPAVKPMVGARPLDSKRVLATFHHSQRKPYRALPGGSLAVQETKRGELIHAVLSHIEFLTDRIEGQVDEALKKAASLHGHQFSVDDIRAVVTAFLTDDNAREMFVAKPGRNVFREREVVNRAGLLYRMDRIVVDPGVVTVVDFKTGGNEMEKDYRAQVANYMEILREVYPGHQVRGIIAYIDRRNLTVVA